MCTFFNKLLSQSSLIKRKGTEPSTAIFVVRIVYRFVSLRYSDLSDLGRTPCYRAIEVCAIVPSNKQL